MWKKKSTSSFTTKIWQSKKGFRIKCCLSNQYIHKSGLNVFFTLSVNVLSKITKIIEF